MSIKRRINRLEAAVPSVDADAGQWRDAAEVLAGVDVTFWPFRHCREPRFSDRGNPAAIEQRRRLYHQRGIPWQGGTGAAGMTALRRRRELQRVGLIESSGSGKSGVHVRIPIAVEQRLRRKIGLPTLHEARYVFHLIPNLVDETGWCRPGGWVHERRLFGLEEDRSPTASVYHPHYEDCMPLLVAGLVESRSSAAGDVFFRQTGQDLPSVPVDGVSVDEAVSEAYFTAWDQAIGDRANWQPIDCNEVFIHLSASR